MTYRVEVAPAALRQLRKLDPPARRRVQAAIELLADQPRPSGAKKLVGGEGEWRVRTGDYRIVYEVHDNVLLVLVVSPLVTGVRATNVADERPVLPHQRCACTVLALAHDHPVHPGRLGRRRRDPQGARCSGGQVAVRVRGAELTKIAVRPTNAHIVARLRERDRSAAPPTRSLRRSGPSDGDRDRHLGNG